MKIKRTRQVDGERFRLQYESGTRDAKLPGESAAIVEAQTLVMIGASQCVRVLDVDADDVLYTVRRENKHVVTYTAAHGTPPGTKASRRAQAAV